MSVADMSCAPITWASTLFSPLATAHTCLVPSYAIPAGLISPSPDSFLVSMSRLVDVRTRFSRRFWWRVDIDPLEWKVCLATLDASSPAEVCRLINLGGGGCVIHQPLPSSMSLPIGREIKAHLVMGEHGSISCLASVVYGEDIDSTRRMLRLSFLNLSPQTRRRLNTAVYQARVLMLQHIHRSVDD